MILSYPRNRAYRLLAHLAALAVIVSQPVLAQSTVEEIERAVDEQWKKLDGFSAVMTVRAEGRDRGVKMSSEISGPLIAQRADDGALRYRSELTGKAKIGPLGILKFDIHNLTVSDGTFRYVDASMNKRRSVSKFNASDPDEASPGGGGQLIRDAREKYNLVEKAESDFNGRRAYVLEGTPRPDADLSSEQLARTVWYFDRDTGLQLWTVGYTKKNVVLSEITMTDIEINPKIAPDTFQFVVPPGTALEDRTVPE